MILQTNTDRYCGKTIARFEDGSGNELSNLVMCSEVVIVLSDGEKIILKPDGRGLDDYISQHTEAERW